MRLPPDSEALQHNATSAPAANTAAVVTITADSNHAHVLDRVWYSFDATPAAAVELTIAFGGTTKFSLHVSSAGVGELLLDGLHNNTKNEAVVITLPAGGVGVIGRLNVLYR